MTVETVSEDTRPPSGGRVPDPGPSTVDPVLQLRGLTKSFGPVQALFDINLDVSAGQVTALVGDNGAGKSTLIKAISGISRPDGGTILWQGRPVEIMSPRDAAALGIATVYQDLALCDNLDVVENMFLGREETHYLLLDETSMEQQTTRALRDLKVVTLRSIRQRVGSLSGGQRQAIAVARAVMGNAQLVIMDEPTAALGVTQTALVTDLIKRLADHGVAVLMISHNLNDVFAVADRIAVLYLGRIAAEAPAAELDSQHVVELITTGTSSRPIASAAGSTTTDRGN